jgi:dienelactone hydrolase
VVQDIADVASFIRNPAGFWSSAEDGFGMLGLGGGGSNAVTAAARTEAACLALVTTPLHDDARRALASFSGSLLGVFSRDDELADGEHVAKLREDAPHGEFVIYGGVGHDFLDDYADPYDFSVARDAIDRIAGFYEKHLPPAPA